MTLSRLSRFATVVSCLVALAACSSVENMLAGDKVDYRSTSTARTSGLEVPPDLTQLSRESRYQQPSGTISASTYQAAASSPGGCGRRSVPVVAPQSVGAFRLERLGNERWLSTTLSPEAVFPQVRAFWKDNGFTLTQDRADAGVLETDWAENRAKLPNDIIRSTIGKVFDAAYSTGELDKFTTRVERTATGSDIFITHRGMIEVYVGDRRDVTTWQHRPAEPQLEATFLSRLMVKLGGKEEVAKTMVASTGNARRAARRARVASKAPRRRRCRSTTASTGPGGASASPSTAAASPSKTAIAARACTSFATSIRPRPVARSRAC